MKDSHKINQNEVDLFDFMQTIWSHKKLITIFTIIAMFIGGTYVLTLKPTYESSLHYSIKNLPPFNVSSEDERNVFERKVLGSFEMRFYSKEIFSKWKKSNKDSVINYNDFGNTKYINGLIFSKDQDELMATFQSNAKGSHILLKTKSLELLNDFYNYSSFVNNSVKSEFITKAKRELNNLETIHEKKIEQYNKYAKPLSENIYAPQYIMPPENINLKRILELKSYLENSDRDDTLFIFPPTVPKNVSPGLVLILLMSAIIGATVGIFYTIFNNSIQQRKN